MASQEETIKQVQDLIDNCIQETGTADENWQEELKQVTAQGGVKGVVSYLTGSLNKWRSIPLNIGVLGNSGTGKSSLINALRGLKATDKGAAKVGTGQTTSEPTAYPHPNNESLKLWDLPGCGTPDFKFETYLEDIKVHQCDFFVLVTSLRLRQEEVLIAQEVRNRGKELYYIRTMIDNDVYNNQKTKGSTKQETIDEVRQHMQQQAAKHNLSYEKFYLISNHDLMDYDFPHLVRDIGQNFPRLKRNAFVMTATANSKEFIELKVKSLRIRTGAMAYFSALGGAVPIPGVGVLVDVPIIRRELQLYHNQLGLTEDGLREVSQMSGVDSAVLRNISASAYPTTVFTTKAIVQLLSLSSSFPAAMVSMVATGLLKFVPVVGSAAGGATSAAVTLWVLNRELSKMHTAALQVMDAACKSVEA